MILVLDARLQGRKTIKPIHRDLRDATSSRLLARSDPRLLQEHFDAVFVVSKIPLQIGLVLCPPRHFFGIYGRFCDPSFTMFNRSLTNSRNSVSVIRRVGFSLPIFAFKESPLESHIPRDKGIRYFLKLDVVTLKRSESANVVNGQTEQSVNFRG